MKTKSELIYILIDRERESEKLLYELYGVLGVITGKEKAEKYPKLLELKQKLKSEMSDDEL
jgi:hypothetical protein